MILAGAAILAPAIWVVLRRANGLPSFGRNEKTMIAAAQPAVAADPGAAPDPVPQSRESVAEPA